MSTVTVIDFDQYRLWRLALATPKEKERPIIDANHPEAGYYRIKHNGQWEPIAYWYDDVGVNCCVGRQGDWFHNDEERHIAAAIEKFPWAWKNPITEEVYNAVCAGERWPDLDETVEQQVIAEVARSRMGDNNPPEDELVQFQIDVENAAAAVERYKNIGDDTTSKAAASARARLNELARTGDKRREALVAPHVAAQRDFNGKWNPFIKTAKAAADAIGKAMGAWETKKRQIADAQAEAEQRAADRAIASGTPPAEQEAPKPAEPAPVVNTQIKGGYGRAASVHFVHVVEEITDWDALVQHYGRKEQSVRDLVLKCVNRDLKNGHEVPFVITKQEASVR